MTFHIVTIFPKIFESYFNYGVLGNAVKKKIVKIKIHDLREFASDKRRTVDDTVYGGGAGMLLKVEPIWRCVESIKKKIKGKGRKTKIVLFCARGKRYEQSQAKRLAKFTDIIMICGRYEGVDERVAKHIVDETISIGEYILTGGEIPAMILVDSISRFLPNILGNYDSSAHESFEKKGYLEYPQYTKPAEFRSWKVPGVLMSGNHKKIEEWRKKNSKFIKSDKLQKPKIPNKGTKHKNPKHKVCTL
jgi:tRNA (guanine37-N1)-methyltransferase